MPQQAEVSTNAIATVIEGLNKRPPSEYVGILTGFPSGAVETHVARDTSGSYLLGSDGATPFVYNLDAVETPLVIRNKSGSIASASSGDFDYLQTSAPHSDLKFLTLGDYTLVLNSSKETADSTEPVEAWDASIGVIQINSGAYSSLYSVEVVDAINDQAITVQVETWPADGTDPFNPTATKNIAKAEASIRTESIAEAMVELLNTGTSTYIGSTRILWGQTGGINPTGSTEWEVELSAQSSSSTFSIQRMDGTPFEIRVSDSRGDTLIRKAHRTAQLFSTLPVHAKVGMAIEVLGDPEKIDASYWVAFRDTHANKATGSWADGYWEESVKPGVSKSFDPLTMPHVLFRQPNGEWQFSPLDGHTYVLGGSEYTLPKWSSRNVGDTEATNKSPKFVGQPLQDLCFHEGRLGLLSGDSIVFSETREPFNFFRVTVLNTLDSDRVELTAELTDDEKFTRVAPLGSDVVVFSNGRQYVVRSEGPLTPTSASFIEAGRFDASNESSPIRRKNALITSNPRGGRGAVFEFRVIGERRPSLERVDLTAIASDYVEELRQVSSSPQSDMMVGLSDKTPDTLWVYTDFMSRGERVMQAWQKWVWPNNPSIITMWFEESVLYVLLAYGSSVRLLQMNCGYHALDTEGGRVFLDCRIDEDDITATLTSGTTVNTILSLPFEPAEDVRCIEKRTFKEIRVLSVNTTSNEVTLEGDWRNKDFFLGSTYSFQHDLSKIYRSDAAQIPIVGEDLFLDSGVINYKDSSEFDVVVTGRDGTSYRNTMMGKFLGDGSNYQNVTLSSGSLRFGVRGRANERTISFQSTSPGPLRLVTADMVARISRERGAR